MELTGSIGIGMSVAASALILIGGMVLFGNGALLSHTDFNQSPLPKLGGMGVRTARVILRGLVSGVLWLNFQHFPQFLFGLEVKLFTAIFRPTRGVPELIGAQGDVWHFWHSLIQLD